MILSLEEVRGEESLGGMTDDAVLRRLDAIEAAIRGHTHNGFNDRAAGFVAASDGGAAVMCRDAPVREGDTIEACEGPNSGLYVVTSRSDDGLVLSRPVAAGTSEFWRVDYPADVKEGALGMLLWSVGHDKSVGEDIQSETISRHSVTYVARDGSNTILGYPSRLMGFCRPHMKARF